jgi:hypothetical protein
MPPPVTRPKEPEIAFKDVMEAGRMVPLPDEPARTPAAPNPAPLPDGVFKRRK